MKKILFLLLTLILAAAGCSVSDGDKTPPTRYDITFSGTVLNAKDRTPVESATVLIAGQQTASEADGSFSLDCAVSEGTSVFSVSADGYVANRKQISVSADQTVQTEILLAPSADEIRVDPAAGAETVVTPEGVQIHLPQLPSITEELDMAVTYFDVATDDISCAPGDFTGIDTNGDAVGIVSRGMINVDITGVDSGNTYSLAGLDKYTVVIPISPEFRDDSPPSIPLWYFDDEQGLWIEEGSATRNGDVYIGTVTHFSTWNCDFKMPDVCSITGTIEDPYGPADDETYAIRITFPGFSKTVSQNGGDTSFTLYNLPPLQELTVSVTKLSTGEEWIKEASTGAGGSLTDLGAFPEEGYLPPVRNFALIRDDDSINLSWSDPASPDLTGINISWTNSDGSVSGSDTAAAGAEYFELAPSPGYYTVSVTPVYNGTDSGFTLSRSINFSDSVALNISVSSDAYPQHDAEDIIYMTIDGMEFPYNGPMLLPPGTHVEIEARLDDIIDGYWIIQWIGNNENEGYSENPLELDLEEDTSIMLYYYPCG